MIIRRSNAGLCKHFLLGSHAWPVISGLQKKKNAVTAGKIPYRDKVYSTACITGPHKSESWYDFFISIENYTMKQKRKSSDKNIQFEQNKPGSGERDRSDSRKNEEQDFKPDDITHNKKENSNNKQTTKETERYGKRHE